MAELCAMATTLKTNTTLVALTLAWNVNDEAAMTLADSLRLHNSITSLTLGTTLSHVEPYSSSSIDVMLYFCSVLWYKRWWRDARRCIGEQHCHRTR